MFDIGKDLQTAYDVGYEHGLKKSFEWISVKDRLPKNNDYVLAWSPRWGECVMCFYDKYSEYWYTEDHSLPFPSHWMPLPEPPKIG